MFQSVVALLLLGMSSFWGMATMPPKEKGAVPTEVDYIVITETPVPTNTPIPTPIPTNTPKPSMTPIRLTSSQYEELFSKYGLSFGVDRDLLRKIAICESNLHTDSRTKDYGGLYQFATSSWIVTRQAMGLDTNPDLRFNPEEAIKTAAFKIKNGGLNSWPNCGR